MRKLIPWMLLGLLLLSGCTAAVLPFDPETQGAVDVIVRQGDALQYYAVSGSGRVQETAAFEGDAITVYEVDSDCFDTYRAIDEDGGSEFVNRLADVSIWDANGDPVPRTQTLMRVLQAASWLEHDLFTVRILRAGEAYFLYVELNVNWWTPCALFWYDPARNGLVELYEFDSRETIGLRVRDLSLLSERPVIRAAWLVSDPLRSFCGGRYLLRMQGDQVNLVGGDAVIIRDVTGYWSLHGVETGFVSAAGYHVLDEATGEIAHFTGVEGMPEDWAARFVSGVTELRFARRPGAVHNPLQSWCGGRYQLRMQDGCVNLVGPDGVAAHRVTGYWWVGSSKGDVAGFVSADGYHVLNEGTGEVAAYASLSDVPTEYAEYFAEEIYNAMNRFPFAYGLSDFAPALAELKTLFGEHRALLDGLIAAVSRQPDWLAGTGRIRENAVFHAVRELDGWVGSKPDSPDWQPVAALFAAMNPRYIGSEHGAVYLHFALVADNGRGAPARLYYAPEAATAEMCSAGWTLWEALGDGWYLAALTE
ncbi:MAG: hypothetical protein IJE07_10965 [Clostridia bacterium]|nr:hypothetical protein [Clostridia bacterium]